MPQMESFHYEPNTEPMELKLGESAALKAVRAEVEDTIRDITENDATRQKFSFSKETADLIKMHAAEIIKAIVAKKAQQEKDGENISFSTDDIPALIEQAAAKLLN